MNSFAHILVVDDDTRIRDLLSRFLKDNGFFVTSAENAFVAREKLKSYIFDIIIVDVMMPGETGVEFTKWLRTQKDVPVLMLTAMGEVEDRITGLESGADDYLPKPFEPRELLLRIKRILKRTKKDKKPQSVKFGNIIFDCEKRALKENGEEVSITSNESKLLTILCDNIGNPVSREDLAISCGGINERSVDVQITRLRNKIEKEPKQPVYLKTIRGKGYIIYGD